MRAYKRSRIPMLNAAGWSLGILLGWASAEFTLALADGASPAPVPEKSIQQLQEEQQAAAKNSAAARTELEEKQYAYDTCSRADPEKNCSSQLQAVQNSRRSLSQAELAEKKADKAVEKREDEIKDAGNNAAMGCRSAAMYNAAGGSVGADGMCTAAEISNRIIEAARQGVGQAAGAITQSAGMTEAAKAAASGSAAAGLDAQKKTFEAARDGHTAKAVNDISGAGLHVAQGTASLIMAGVLGATKETNNPTAERYRAEAGKNLVAKSVESFGSAVKAGAEGSVAVLQANQAQDQAKFMDDLKQKLVGTGTDGTSVDLSGNNNSGNTSTSQNDTSGSTNIGGTGLGATAEDTGNTNIPDTAFGHGTDPNSNDTMEAGPAPAGLANAAGGGGVSPDSAGVSKGGGTGTFADKDENKAAAVAGKDRNTKFESDGGPRGGTSGGGAGGFGMPDLSGLFAGLLPKEEEKKDGKNSILDYGNRGVASEGATSLLGKDVNIFKRISETYQRKNKELKLAQEGTAPRGK